MPTTDGITVAEKTVAEAGAEKNPTPTPGEKDKGIEGRIAELTAEKHRKDEKIAKLEKEIADLAEKFKSEDEKRIDQLVNERVTPVKSRLEQIETRLKGELSALLDEIPAEHRGLVMTGDYIPVEDQIAQARSALALLGKQKPGSISGGGRPGSSEKPVYEMRDYNAWVGSIYSDPKFYEANRAEMQAAIKEGRIKGLK